MARKAKGKNRGYITLECTDCKSRNYRTQKRLRNTDKLELKKHCRTCNKHTLHKERKK